MNVFFTICSNNYLAQASILGNSVRRFHPEATFFIFLCDERQPSIDYNFAAGEIIPVAVAEPGITDLAERYDIVELNTVVKPTIIQYLFAEKKAASVIFLDPDTRLYAPLNGLYQALQTASILLTPHILTPIPIDGKTPGENTFLNYGIYNLGFIMLKDDPGTRLFLDWWKQHTYLQGYRDKDNGIFVDQLPITLAPLFFKNIRIMDDPGLNMAPWNLHERQLSEGNDSYVVNGVYPLKFFHFSSFTPGGKELPLHHYNRFRLEDRTDLQHLYAAYDQELHAAGYTFYQQFACTYAQQYALAKKRTKKTNRLKNWSPAGWFSKK